MDTTADQPNVTTLVLQLIEKVAGDDAVKRLEAVQKAAEAAQEAIDKYNASLEASGAVHKAAGKVLKTLQGAQAQVANVVSNTHAPIKQQTTLLRRLASESNIAARAAGALAGGLGKVAALAGVGSIGYLAVSRIRQTISKEWSLAMAGGPDQVTLMRGLTGGRNLVAGMDLAGRFQMQSPYARFGLGEGSLKGLSQAQAALEKVGLDRANDIILAVTESLEPKALKRFVETAAGGDVKSALMGAANDRNIMAVTTAINALTTSQGLAKSPEQVDSVLRSAAKVEEASQRIADAFDQVVSKLADQLAPEIDKAVALVTKAAGWAGTIGTPQGPSLTQVGLGALGTYAGLKIGGKAAWWAGGKALGALGGLLGLGGGGAAATIAANAAPAAATAGVWAGQAAPVITGFAPVAAAPEVAAPAVATGVGLGGLAAAGLAGLGIGAAALGVGLSGGMGLGYLMERKGLIEAEQRAAEQRAKMDEIAQRTEGLRGERQRQDVAIAKYAEDNKRGFISSFFGADTLSDKDKAVLAEMQKRRDDLTRQIEEASKAADAPPTPTVAEKIGEDAAKAQPEVAKLTDNVQRLQDNAAKRPGLNLTAQEAGSVTSLSRLQAQIAETTPLGQIGALPEIRALQETITTEIESLKAILSSIDQGTQEGVIEANKVRAEILGLTLEQKQNALKLRQAMMSGIIAQAFGAGRFEKILFNETQNVGKGIELGVLNPDNFPQWNKTGAPVPAAEVYGQGYEGVYQAVAGAGVQRVQVQKNKVDQLREIAGGIDALIKIEEADSGAQDNSRLPPRQPRQLSGTINSVIR